MNLRVLNVTLRFSALLTRFFFSFTLVFFLTTQEVGVFGLIAASLTCLVYLLGLDFYIYANRELCGSLLKIEIIKHSIVFYALNYVIMLPLISIIFLLELLPEALIYKFYILLVLEHIGQETYRLLIVLGKPILASINLFLRIGLWAAILSILMIFFPTLRNIDTILIFWIIGSVSSLIVVGVVIKNRLSLNKKWIIDWNWIKTGLKTSVPFFFSTICLKGIVTIDRFWIEYLTSQKILGVYVFFTVLSNSLIALLESGIFSFMMPKLIHSADIGNKEQYVENFKILWRESLIVILFFSIISAILLPIILNIIDNPVYSENITYYYLCLFGVDILSMSMVFNIGLYSQKNDRPIIISHIVGFFVFIITTLVLVNITKYYAIPIGVINGYLFILSLKYYFHEKTMHYKYK